MKILAVSSRGVCVEIENQSPYFAPEKFTVMLNGTAVREESANVFSLFGLEPESCYELSAAGQSVKFKTGAESALFNVRDFNARGDGINDDTSAFAAAIACLPAGGTLFVPADTF